MGIVRWLDLRLQSLRNMIRFLFNLKLKNPKWISIKLKTTSRLFDFPRKSNDNRTQVLNILFSSFGSQTLSFQQTGYVKLIFPTLTHLWQVYNILLSMNNGPIPLIHFHVPWSNEDLYNLVSLRDPSSPSKTLPKTLDRQMRLKLHRLPRSSIHQYPSLELFLDPNSSYTLRISSSFLDILSQLIRYYIFLLPTFLFTVLCVSYFLQVNYTNLRTYQTMLAWQVHMPIILLISVLYYTMIYMFPSSNFVVNVHANGYYFLLLPAILYFLALSLWAVISFVIDYLLLDSIRSILLPIFAQVQIELNQQTRYSYIIQSIALSIPLFATLILGGSNGHITLFIIASLHIIWRGTINRRLREILTTLLLFHGLLVILHLTGFIVHVKSIIVQGLYPLYFMMPDPSLVSSIFCIFAFYVRFLFTRSSLRFIQTIKSIFSQYNRVILISLAISAQFLCAYSMYYLWIFICLIFIHVAMIFFIPLHQE